MHGRPWPPISLATGASACRRNAPRAWSAASSARIGSLLALVAFVSSSIASTSPSFSIRDDYAPSLAIDSTGAPWVAWVSSPADTSSSGMVEAVYAARWNGSSWDTTRVSAGPGRFLDPQIVADEAGVVVAWVVLDGFGSDLEFSRYDGSWAGPFAAGGPGAKSAPALAVDRGGSVWAAWQEWTGDSYDILVGRLSGGSLVDRAPAADGPADDREPDITRSEWDGFWVAWSSVRGSRPHDEICARLYDRGGFLPPMIFTRNDRSWCRYPSIATDADGSLWVAYYKINRCWKGFEGTGPEPTDLGSIRILRFKWMEIAIPEGTSGNTGIVPRPLMEEVGYDAPPGPVRVYGHRPRLLIDASRRVWVFSKMNGYYLDSGVQNLYWGIFGVSYDGDAWSECPAVFVARGAHFWDAPAAAFDPAGKLWMAWTSDRRQTNPIRGSTNIFGPDADIRVDSFEVGTGSGEAPEVMQSHWVWGWDDGEPRSVPRYTVESSSATYGIYWGENHRHSCEFSYDGIWDLPFEETIDFAFERVGYDWIAPGEHAECWSPLVWTLLPKWIDLHRIPDLALFPGYEKSGRRATAHGDQNVLLASTGDWFSGDMPTTVFAWSRFYSSFRGKDALIIPHHTASGEGLGFTMWDEVHPQAGDTTGFPVRLVEIYQRCRGSSERPGCPLEIVPPRVGADTGWVNLAWAGGRRLGVAAGGDHNPGNGFTAALAEDGSPEAIFAALRARRCYATSNSKKIFLDFRVDGHWMGEEFVATSSPSISYRVYGTEHLVSVRVVKNGDEEWYVSTPERWAEEDSAVFLDPDPPEPGSTACYYLRAEESDSGVAWSSPVWANFPVETPVVERGEDPSGAGVFCLAYPVPFEPSRASLVIRAGGAAPEPPPAARIYSPDGCLVRELTLSRDGFGSWDGRGASGRRVAPGVYFVSTAGGPERGALRKIVVLR